MTRRPTKVKDCSNNKRPKLRWNCWLYSLSAARSTGRIKKNEIHNSYAASLFQEARHEMPYNLLPPLNRHFSLINVHNTTAELSTNNIPSKFVSSVGNDYGLPTRPLTHPSTTLLIPSSSALLASLLSSLVFTLLGTGFLIASTLRLPIGTFGFSLNGGKVV